MHIFDNAHKKLFEIFLCLKYDNHVLFATSNLIKLHKHQDNKSLRQKIVDILTD